MGLGAARFDLQGADLAGANLSGANPTKARLTGADLVVATWTGGRLCGAGSLRACR